MAKFWSVLVLLSSAFFCCKGASIGVSDDAINGNFDEIRGRQIDELAQPKILIPWSQKLALLFPTTTTTTPAPAPAPAAAAPAAPAVPGGGFLTYAAPPGIFDNVDFGRRPNSQLQPIFIVGQPNMPFPFWG